MVKSLEVFLQEGALTLMIVTVVQPLTFCCGIFPVQTQPGWPPNPEITPRVSVPTDPRSITIPAAIKGPLHLHLYMFLFFLFLEVEDEDDDKLTLNAQCQSSAASLAPEPRM